MFGRLNDYERMPGKDKVFGLRRGDKQVAVSLAYLKKHGRALITGVGDPIMVTYDQNSGTASAFVFTGSQRAAVKGLKVEGDRMIAPGGRAVWDSRTGKLVEGDGTDLSAVPMMSAFWFAWLSFYPDTELVH
jgi:hypothetical protein